MLTVGTCRWAFVFLVFLDRLLFMWLYKRVLKFKIDFLDILWHDQVWPWANTFPISLFPSLWLKCTKNKLTNCANCANCAERWRMYWSIFLVYHSSQILYWLGNWRGAERRKYTLMNMKAGTKKIINVCNCLRGILLSFSPGLSAPIKSCVAH